jgi:hypothetical protein
LVRCILPFFKFSRQEELKRVERERQAKYKKQREVPVDKTAVTKLSADFLN